MRQEPAPDADFDLLWRGYRETCEAIASLEARADGAADVRQVMARFARGLPQNADGLHEARSRAGARLCELEAKARG